MWKVQVSSSRSIFVTPGTLRACCMLVPWVPMARPIRSSLTVNCSWKRAAICLDFCRTFTLTENKMNVAPHFLGVPPYPAGIRTSRCLMASWLPWMTKSLLRRLRKCISLIILVLFRVTSFTDWPQRSGTCYLFIYNVAWSQQPTPDKHA